MDVRQSYNRWASQYDTNINKTRDIESLSLKSTLSEFQFENCLEIGCGTGKNTEWLISKSKFVSAIDISEEMLAIAKEKIKSDRVQFYQRNILGDWTFVDRQFDLVTFSLVLEHIENLFDIFQKVSKVVTAKGYVYIGELHPFKQYLGTKARFDTVDGQQIVSCFNHHISDFTNAAKSNGFEIVKIDEFFDDNKRKSIPRILTLLFSNRF